MPEYVFGGSATVEPEGFELESIAGKEPCPKCGEPADHWFHEVNEGGCINVYAGGECGACGYEKGGRPDEP
jgi:hypothetical protein